MPLSSKILSILFPRRCRICHVLIRDGNKNFVCGQCWSDISLIKPPFCAICSIPFFSDSVIPEGYICGRCRANIPCFDYVISFAVYSGVVKELLHHYKYSKKAGLVKDLVHLIASFPERVSSVQGDIVLHIPLHKSRLKKRGFDQSFLLAQHVSVRLNLPFISNNLTRKKNTAMQSGLSKKARANNIKGAFIIKRPEELTGKSILLIDDVMTTGATANECSGMLKKAGAKYISVLTLARTLLNC